MTATTIAADEIGIADQLSAQERPENNSSDQASAVGVHVNHVSQGKAKCQVVNDEQPGRSE